MKPKPKPKNTSASKSMAKQTPDQVLKFEEFKKRFKAGYNYQKSVTALAKARGIGSGLSSKDGSKKMTLATVGKTRRSQSRGR